MAGGTVVMSGCGCCGSTGVINSCCGVVPVPETLSLTVTATGCTDNGAVAILEYDDVDSWVGADDKCDVLWVLTCTAGVWSLSAFLGGFPCSFSNLEDPVTFDADCGPPFSGLMTAFTMNCPARVCANCTNVIVTITEI
jgi:hypothetical protein